MSIKTIRSLLEQRLADMPAGLITGWEGVPFEPVEGTAHQLAYLLPGRTQNPTFGDSHERHVGIFQVSVYAPSGVGTGAISNYVQSISDWFLRGVTLTSVSPVVNLLIDQSASIASLRTDGSWLVSVVSIPYVADVYK